VSQDTIAGLVAAQAALGSKPLLVADQDRLTYGEADVRSRRAAAGLLAAGVARGSRVARFFGNTPDFVVGFLAITRIGAVALPFSTMSTADELRGLLDGSDCEYLISDSAYRGRDLVRLVTEVAGADPGAAILNPALPTLRRIWIGVQGLEAAGGDAAAVAAAEAQVTPADELVLVHTSGSTSRPKGVIHTHGSVIRNMRRLNAVRGLTAEDRLLSNSPFFWIGGLAYSLLATMIAGGRLICSAASPPETLDLIEAERPNVTNGFAATVLNLANDPSFARRDLTFIRRGNLHPLLAADARPADPELRHNMLGMTETGSVCLIGEDEADLPESRRGSFGRPVPEMQARVVDPDTGEDATVGQEGELWLRGPAVMQGYYGVERHETFAAGGWYRSGDIVRTDADGLYYFRGRRGDMIKTAGANVSPREVEAALAELCPGRLPIVLGLPDPEKGQVVAAVVIGDDPVDEAGLREALGLRLSRYKVPRRIVALPDDQTPRLSSGKVDMKRLAEVVREL
jgi:acyl-CoA synthetase (AMP-forming)/AMP-acid ligase II